MTSLRDARAGALIRRHRDLADDFTRALPLLLDDLDAIDAAHGTEPVSVKREDDTPTDDQLAAWIERNPKAFADWAAKQARIRGANWPSGRPGGAPASKPPMSALPPAAPAKPATRRRTTR